MGLDEPARPDATHWLALSRKSSSRRNAPGSGVQYLDCPRRWHRIKPARWSSFMWCETVDSETSKWLAIFEMVLDASC